MISAALFSWEDWLAPSVVSGDVSSLQRGDRDALVALLSLYKNRLYRYLRRLVREPAAAEDLFQQTWLRVIEQIRRYDGRRSFEAWLALVPYFVGVILYFILRNPLRNPLRTPCPNCATDVPVAFAFCPGCGASVHPTCSNCGKPMERSWANCPNCGLRISPPAEG